MRITGMLATACLLLLVSSPIKSAQTGKAKDLIVGKWDIGMNTVFEYKKDGTFVMTVGTVAINGKYTFVSDDTMEVEITVGDKTRKNRLKVVIKDNEMTTTDPEGKSNKLTRIK
ncbi:hypothetical protein AYO44_00675 [Planctomycetaceae bacterium SCGC AG-212-F19]|nr:hypothetical protein AYO44_00675 [Planctomycetaceae bacterium SCGC AG-212-F19]